MVNARGHVPFQLHPQHVHVEGRCPPPSADTNEDGLIDIGEGLPFYGPVLIALDGDLTDGMQPSTFPVIGNRGGALTYRKTASLEELVGPNGSPVGPLELGRRTVVLHGAFVDGTYEPTLPVACGEIHPIP
jgi:hypothetical protein